MALKSLYSLIVNTNEKPFRHLRTCASLICFVCDKIVASLFPSVSEGMILKQFHFRRTLLLMKRKRKKVVNSNQRRLRKREADGRKALMVRLMIRMRRVKMRLRCQRS